MAANDSSTVGVYDNLEKAERTLDELRRAGFTQDEIGIIGNVGNESPVLPTPTNRADPEFNVTSGVLSGGMMGAVVGALVIIAIPGLGEVSGFGWWFEILGGLLLGAAAGGILLAYSSLFVSKTRARFFTRQIEKGRYIVTVKNPARQQEAVSLLRGRGGYVENVQAKG